jgi:protoporphyrinogen oxidase
MERLCAEGFSSSVIERFFRPFFGGVFLDPELATSERQMEFVFRMFSAGDIAVPAGGMGEIPRQLAACLERSRIRTETAVESIDGRGVQLASGGRLDADAVVVATDAFGAAKLVPTIESRDWLGVTCLYYEAPEPPVRGPYLVLNGECDGPINNLCVMSEVTGQPPSGEPALVSVTALGARDGVGLEDTVLEQLHGWFGRQVRRWRHLKTYRIDRALPEQAPPLKGVREPKIREGLYVCGDHWHDASINGAIASGRRAAEAVIRDAQEKKQ